MNPRTWRDDLDLPERVTWLLEASAGTGKTYQIAGLFVRMVAEYGLEVERILTITFTKAAAAELRSRVRQRLRDALAALESPPASHEDLVIARLCARGDHEAMRARLELALRGFDLAPISTIHGFSQRMLEEFAFDSGQDQGLTLLDEPAEIVEQIVDDSLASLYAVASARELGAYQSAGVTRDNLIAAAKAMSDAAEPRVAPEGEGEGLLAGLAEVRDWIRRVDAMRRYLDSSEVHAALSSLQAEYNQFKSWNLKWVTSARAKLTEWLANGAVEPIDVDHFKYVRVAKMRADYKHADLESRPYWPVALAIDAFCEEQRAFAQRFNPLADFARAARARVEAEITRRRALTFSGMLSRLAERIEADGGAQSPIAKRIRERFHAAFVDEFQDTDQVQWQVIEAAFHGHRRLFLIGDPKQAIYGFRGADVHVYLQAAQAVDAERRYTMATNWRSDLAAVTAQNHLWRAGSGAFDQDPIDYIQVNAHHPPRLSPPGAGLELRWVDGRTAGGAPGEPIGNKPKSQALVARLVAIEAAGWLRGERGEIIGGDDRRGVKPADLAVLVNDRYEAEAARRALANVGIRAIAASKDSVFETEVASWLAHWLDAVAGAGHDRSSRTAVVTPLFGWTADELAWALERARPEATPTDKAHAEGRDFTAWTDRLRSASERWYREGFSRVFDKEASDLGVYERVLALPGGERHATDLRHLFELCHAEERARRHGPAALAEWLRAQKSDAKPTRGEEVVQRLESDADAVTIETIHASKGLEYPVVLLPFGWAAKSYTEKGRPLLVQGEGGASLNLDRAGTEGRRLAIAAYEAEQAREALRRLYVALTRAKHRTVAWYGPLGSDGAETSATALGRLLMRSPEVHGYGETLPVFKAPAKSRAPAKSAPKPSKKAASAPTATPPSASAWVIAEERLDTLVGRAGGTIAWAAEPAPTSIAPLDLRSDASTTAPQTATWPSGRGPLEGAWTITSFTRITGAWDRNEKVTPEPAEPAAIASPARLPAYAHLDPPAEVRAFPSLPRLSKGSGTEYGTWVHSVFERLAFEMPDANPEAASPRAKDGRSLAELIAAERPGMRGADAIAVELETIFPSLLTTPLDADDATKDPTLGLPAGFTLSQLTRRDRLDELGFDLRLGDGSRWQRGSIPSGMVEPARVYDAILSHEGLAHGHPRWMEQLRMQRERGVPLIAEVVGILTGSIDLAFRVSGGSGARYFLADYKTNRLGASAPGNYAHAWLGWEMAKANYALQSLIYTVALHRHLRARLPGYDYEAHMGGYLYLFLRGMSGPSTPRDPGSGRCLGVYGGRWPEALVRDVDAALAPSLQASTPSDGSTR